MDRRTEIYTYRKLDELVDQLVLHDLTHEEAIELVKELSSKLTVDMHKYLRHREGTGYSVEEMRKVCELIHKKPGISREEIVEKTGLTHSQVILITAGLEDKGVIHEH